MPTMRTRAAKGSALTHNELDANFKRPIAQKTTDYTILVGDNRSVLECSHATTPFTITLAEAGTMDNAETGDYFITIKNTNVALVTVARSGADTIDGATSIVLHRDESITVQAGVGDYAWNIISRVRTGNSVIQVVNNQTSAVSAPTAVAMPNDDTIPQITEGAEILTMFITPKQTTNLLKIDVTLNLATAGSGGIRVTAALFNTDQHATNALTVAQQWHASNNIVQTLSFTHYVTAAVITSSTFSVRVGDAAGGTITLNGEGGSRKYGDAMESQITITEYSGA